MRVKELREELAKLPDDMFVGLAVNRHSWYAPADSISHGPGQISQVRLHYANGKSQIIALITHSLGFPFSDGYLPEVLITTEFARVKE